jgi:hypothetical protein
VGLAFRREADYAKGQHSTPKGPAAMVAIYAIAIFLVAILALNFISFGRLD